MAFGNNRAGEQPRAHFQLAGGASIKFRHPYLAGMINTETGTGVDEIDISKCLKLEGRYFEANQNQDSARQVVLMDGSTVTVCNKLLNGTITLSAIKTTGLVATGDFIAACQLIQATGDTVGGMIIKTDYLNGNAITKVYYGVTVQRCPADVSEGNDVGVYNIQLVYAGWLEATSSSADRNKKRIWAVGSSQGIEGFYSPYNIQNSTGVEGTKKEPMKADALTPDVGDGITDSSANNVDNSQEVEAVTSGDTKSWGQILKKESILEFSTKEEDKTPSSTTPNP